MPIAQFDMDGFAGWCRIVKKYAGGTWPAIGRPRDKSFVWARSPYDKCEALKMHSGEVYSSGRNIAREASARRVFYVREFPGN